MKVLVIGAHPDDEVIGPGGTLARHALQGDEVYGLILTDGHSSRDDEQKEETIRQRKQQARLAAGILRFSGLKIESFPDQALDTFPITEITRTIEAYSQEVQPDVVYVHHHGDANVDHQVVFKAALVAFRSVGKNYPSQILAYETLSSTEWGGVNESTAFIPNFFVDITSTIDLKMEAMACYSGELREYPHPRSEQGIRVSSKRWGTVCGFEYAEAFNVIRNVWK